MSKRNFLTFFSIFKAKDLALRLAIVTFVIATVLLASTSALAAITVTPSTWNVIGLDSNSPAFGPYRFPVGAKVCSDTAASNIPVNFSWDAGGTDSGTYINLRPGSSSSINIDIPAGGCTDAFFEVELNRTSAAFDQTRRFHITASGVSTPTPRE
ncbi:MAG: hypothetical protein KAU27_11090, partial [Desulfuromonadales bacterium]|nr:hypothetical protein [Desulfuromonadales bacterium]